MAFVTAPFERCIVLLNPDHKRMLEIRAAGAGAPLTSLIRSVLNAWMRGDLIGVVDFDIQAEADRASLFQRWLKKERAYSDASAKSTASLIRNAIKKDRNDPPTKEWAIEGATTSQIQSNRKTALKLYMQFCEHLKAL